MNFEDELPIGEDSIDGIKLTELRRRKRSIVSVMKDVIKQDKKDDRRNNRKESTSGNGGRKIREMIMSIFHNVSPASISSEDISAGELRPSRSLPTVFDGDNPDTNCYCSETPDSAITGSSVTDENKLQAPLPDHRNHKGSWPSSHLDYTRSVARSSQQRSEYVSSREKLPVKKSSNSDAAPLIVKDIPSAMSAPNKDLSHNKNEAKKPGNAETDSTIRNSIDTELKRILRGKRYHPELAKIWCRKISDRVTKNIQELTNHKKKVVTAVYIGQVQGERVDVAVKCQRDSNLDNFATVYTTGNHLYAWVSVVALDMRCDS